MDKTLAICAFILANSLLLKFVKAQEFEPDSIYTRNKRIEVFDPRLQVSNRGMGGNIFLGHGLLGGNISNHFNNPWFIGINVDIHRSNFVFQIDDYIGFGTVKEGLTFRDGSEWKKGRAAFSLMLGTNVGYSVIDTKTRKLVPLAGIGVSLLSSSPFRSGPDVFDSPFIPQYKLGFYLDIKPAIILQEHLRVNNKDVSYASLRLSWGVTSPIGKTKRSEYYNGSMIYFTIGMGGFSRNFEIL